MPLYLGKHLCSSGLFAKAERRYGEIDLPVREQKIILCARWQGESDCTVRFLKPDGTLVLSQANGQVCFLQVYHGNRPITIAELENLRHKLLGTAVET